ncbi:class I SAM-dependent methyltransferase [Saccharothrix saharensis]|uniref:class I SAM-dependent methyltransferase n=1 Tax=Saccharothrix saharensis TaxID=571190 RepID=UPI003696C875
MEPHTTAEWEALLYDWHNDHLLRAQRADVDYWQASTADADRLLVLGAGTGRVAAPLARHRPRLVTALDLSPARLRRVPAVPGLRPVCGDMRRLPLAGGFDAAIVPYSAMQLLVSPRDRDQALVDAARVLTPDGFLHVDVSGNFDTRPPKN